MAHYIDGFVFPIAQDSVDDYLRLAAAAAEIWKEHGALEYKEFVGDDMTLEGTRSFADATQATEKEVVVFGWVQFESRDARDQANAKVAADPRMLELMEASTAGFDAGRMVYGGFRYFGLSPQSP